jgi:glycosyltransferase involved in cell wall biosynthesis
MAALPKLFFVYLGRRGAMPKFALDLARATSGEGSPAPMAIASENELAPAFENLANPIAKLRMFSHGAGAVLETWRIGEVRRQLGEAIERARPDYVVELMPHVWSPFLEDVPRRLGVRRASIVHDARAHPGDPSAIATSWLLRSAMRADRIVTLSTYVANEIVKRRPDLEAKVTALFHPDFDYPSAPAPTESHLRVLFLGRLLAYKGLDLCVEAVEKAVAGGARVRLTVAGKGSLADLRNRLMHIGAEVIERWLDHDEIGRLLAKCDAVAATYNEASQSGVVAAAFGAGRPVIATPVGALPEQVADERTGLVARDVTSDAIADVVARLASDRALVARLAANVAADAPLRSMKRFAASLADALAVRPG